MGCTPDTGMSYLDFRCVKQEGPTWARSRSIKGGTPPRLAIGGGPKEREGQAFSHPATPLRQPIEMAEGGPNPEKNHEVWGFGPAFGARGSTVVSRRRGSIAL